MQRVIEFETVTDEGATRVEVALAEAFEALDRERPQGVRLAYWRVSGGRGFLALIELSSEQHNPLLDLPATRRLPGVIADCVDGGYPHPLVVQPVGEYGFGR